MMRTLQQSRRNQDVSAKMGARAKVRTISFFFKYFHYLHVDLVETGVPGENHLPVSSH
jgi:hypothetical protein